MPENLNRVLLEAALTGLEIQKARIDEHIAAVRSQLGVRGPGRGSIEAEPEVSSPARKKRHLSAAGRRAIVEATKKRWAAVRAQKQASPAAKPKKRNMSAAARNRIADAQKMRWAAFRAKQAAGAKKSPAKVVKKAASKKTSA
jgi:hypothetical protein